MARRRQPEAEIQRAVFDHIRLRGVPGLVAWHTPNGGRRNLIEAAKFKALGVRAGVSDVIAVHNGRIFALELKAPGGSATEAQHAFIGDMAAAGAFTCVADSLDRALAVLESWGLLRVAKNIGGRPAKPAKSPEPTRNVNALSRPNKRQTSPASRINRPSLPFTRQLAKGESHGFGRRTQS